MVGGNTPLSTPAAAAAAPGTREVKLEEYRSLATKPFDPAEYERLSQFFFTPVATGHAPGMHSRLRSARTQAPRATRRHADPNAPTRFDRLDDQLWGAVKQKIVQLRGSSEPECRARACTLLRQLEAYLVDPTTPLLLPPELTPGKCSSAQVLPMAARAGGCPHVHARVPAPVRRAWAWALSLAWALALAWPWPWPWAWGARRTNLRKRVILAVPVLLCCAAGGPPTTDSDVIEMIDLTEEDHDVIDVETFVVDVLLTNVIKPDPDAASAVGGTFLVHRDLYLIQAPCTTPPVRCRSCASSALWWCAQVLAPNAELVWGGHHVCTSFCARTQASTTASSGAASSSTLPRDMVIKPDPDAAASSRPAAGIERTRRRGASRSGKGRSDTGV